MTEVVNFRDHLTPDTQYKISDGKMKSGYYGILRMANGGIAYTAPNAHQTRDAAIKQASSALHDRAQEKVLRDYVNNNLFFVAITIKTY